MLLLKVIHKQNKYIVNVLIDIDDLNFVSSFSWFADFDNHTKSYYIMTSIKNKSYRLHRLLMKTPNHLVVDHINLDPTDNRRRNLRNVTPTENARNQGIYRSNKTGRKGICYIKNKKADKFVVTWRCDARNRHKRSFSVTKYGYNKAKNMAHELRDKIENKFKIRHSTFEKR